MYLPNFFPRAIIEPLVHSSSFILTYNGNITVGNSVVPVLYDTGSCQLWVNQKYLAPSSTYVNQNRPAPEINYMDGTRVNGFFSNDDVSIGNATVKNLEFETVTEFDSSFPNDPTQAIAGLCYKNPSSDSKNFVDAAVDAGVFTSRVFTYQILDNAKAQLDFDVSEFNTSAYIGNITFTPVISDNGHWQISMLKLSLNNGSYVYTKQIPAIVDTGTSLMYLPPDIYEAWNADLGYIRDKSGYPSGPCSALVNKTVELEFYNTRIILPASSFTTTVDGRTCKNLINTVSGNSVLLGNMFLKNFYTVFDKDHSRVGFGLKTGTFVETGTAPSSESRHIIYIAVAVGVVLIALVSGFCFMRSCRK